MAVRLAATDGVFDGGQFCVVFSHMVSWVGSRIEPSQFLRVFLLTYVTLRDHNRSTAMERSVMIYGELK